MRSPIDFAPVAYAQRKHSYRFILNLAKDAIVANAVLPEIAEFGTRERFAYAAWIGEIGQALQQEPGYPNGDLPV